MDLAQLITNRRTIQTFLEDKVSDELVKKALELSLWSMNHKLTFPWHYIEVTDLTRKKIADIGAELKKQKDPRVSETVLSSIRASIMTPSHMIFLGQKKGSSSVEDKENYATLSGSVHLASLFLWLNGIGTKWTTSGYRSSAKTYEVLRVSPEEVKLEGALFIGKSAQIVAPKDRPPIEEILRRV